MAASCEGFSLSSRCCPSPPNNNNSKSLWFLVLSSLACNHQHSQWQSCLEATSLSILLELFRFYSSRRRQQNDSSWIFFRNSGRSLILIVKVRGRIKLKLISMYCSVWLIQGTRSVDYKPINCSFEISDYERILHLQKWALESWLLLSWNCIRSLQQAQLITDVNAELIFGCTVHCL